MTYELAEAPFEWVPFEDMNKQQADRYFRWYVSMQDERINYLEQHIKDTGGVVNLDNSPESLIPLWKWLEQRIFTHTRTNEEVERLMQYHPEWMRSELEGAIAIDDYTYAVGLDIAYYFAAVIIKQFPSIHWGYFVKPKNYMSVNQPVLLGFKNGAYLNPTLIVSNLIRNSSKEKDPMRFQHVYKIWTSKLEE